MGQDCVLSRGRSITRAGGRHAARKCRKTAIDSSPLTSQVKHRFSKNSQDSHVAKSDLGTKRICPTTGKKFYDLNKSPVISPFTGELVSLEEADAEENTGKVKAVVPESEDDIEVDETIEGDDDDDSTFIADEEEGDEDVTDIIGEVGGDEET